MKFVNRNVRNGLIDGTVRTFTEHLLTHLSGPRVPLITVPISPFNRISESIVNYDAPGDIAPGDIIYVLKIGSHKVSFSGDEAEACVHRKKLYSKTVYDHFVQYARAQIPDFDERIDEFTAVNREFMFLTLLGTYVVIKHTLVNRELQLLADKKCDVGSLFDITMYHKHHLTVFMCEVWGNLVDRIKIYCREMKGWSVKASPTVKRWYKKGLLVPPQAPLSRTPAVSMFINVRGR